MVIEPMLTDQWFVDTARIVQPAIDAVREGRTKIIPEQHEKVYFHWLENIEPWTISRQLWWGHQIPVWYGPDVFKGQDGNLHLTGREVQFCAANEEAVRALARKRYGESVVVTFDASPNARVLSTHSAGFVDDANQGERLTSVQLTRDPDVLDT
ncbi:class I tRNA ligase family protein, partial [Streptomyces asiaticus]|uniref:class I tRNA ligase family protein n=1 Tax=Streptomyces asiaticus TaxID=114695 RepID=UPI003F67DCCE